ncbi:MAG TPA: arsenate reductase family protein [Gemmatimonadaceae bacterium]|nr:arsenate reductase family protein [Gemmatimonadaceae bacterium]
MLITLYQRPTTLGSTDHWSVLLDHASTLARPMEVQIFGTKKSTETRKALRFFAERRVKTHFVDLNERAASLGELKRFAQKFGVGALIDKESKRYAELGLAHARYGDDRWLERLVEEPLLLRQPLVRQQHQLTVGSAEETWKEWLGK